VGLKFNDGLDDATLDDQQNDWRGGADEFATPTNLARNTGGRLINCIVEDNGRPRNRPGADKLGDLAVGSRIQCLSYYDTPTLEYIFASVAASLRQWDGAAWTNVGAYPFGAETIAAMAQGHDKLYCSTGVGQWYSYDGAAWSAGEGTTANDPPVGATIMAWHSALNRMFASGVIAGQYDALYASLLDNASAGAGKWSAANWSVRVGRGEGERIQAICPAKGFWLAVGKEGSIYMVYADPTALSASQWQIPRLAGSVGVVGSKAMVYGGDSLWCIGPDLALREIIPSIGSIQSGDAPFQLLPAASEPAKPYFDRINEGALSKIALHVYGRYLLAALPLDDAMEPSHVCVWNLRLRVASNVPGATIPAFIGVWTGWTPTAFLTSRFAGAERLIIGDSAGRVNEWKDAEDQTLTDTYKDNATAVLATMRGRSWDFQTQRNGKDAESVELQFIDSTPQVDVVAVLDTEEQRRWTVQTQQIQNQLPLQLPFDLAVEGPTRATKNADELLEFREMYLEVQQLSAGRLELKSMAGSAFLNTQANE
jgi:hypothetical protein